MGYFSRTHNLVNFYPILLKLNSYENLDIYLSLHANFSPLASTQVEKIKFENEIKSPLQAVHMSQTYAMHHFWDFSGFQPPFMIQNYGKIDYGTKCRFPNVIQIPGSSY